ncbi:ABC transporter substrate-binding protein [Enterovirga rhinocerotis]|nr:ABC transporter substrate-binding protein [Enterovirga rhinocerotis]
MLAALPAHSQISDGVVKLGVINDQSGPFSSLTGPGSVLAIRMAVEDMKPQLGDIRVEILVADHQNKPDVGVATVKRWLDVDNIDAVLDVSNSSVALGVQTLIRERNKVALYGIIGTTELTGKQCAKTGFSWVHDAYALVSGPVKTLTKGPEDTWYFLGADFEFGKNMVQVAKRLVTARGGKTVGEAFHPMSEADFSSYLLQAQGSKAKMVAFANAGTQLVNVMKQWQEFGMQGGGQRPIATLLSVADVHAAGMDVMQGLTATTAWYWGLNDDTRAFAKRFFARFNAMPTESQAGMYSATMHYLKAVAATKTDATDAVVSRMREVPVDDMFAKGARLRPDGKLAHDFLLVTVKTKQESKAPWDYYKVDAVIPSSDAFTSLEASDCPLVTDAAKSK